MRFEVRMIFNSKVLIREAIKVYAMENKKKPSFQKERKHDNGCEVYGSKRLIVVCTFEELC